MTSLPQVVATDLDGTLLRSDETVSAYTSEVLRLLSERGVDLIAVTARPPRWLDGLAALTGSHGLAVCCNGAVVYEVGPRRVLSCEPLPAQTVREVAADLRARIPGIAFAVERVDGAGREPAYVYRREQPRGSPVEPLEQLLDVAVVKLLARCDAMAPADFHQVVAAVVDGRVELAYSGAVGLAEMTAAGVTKASGLAAWCQARGVSPPDVWGFGDMPNDLPMLAWVGRSFAVANAAPEVIATATDLCPSNDEDGVARTLDLAFGLIRARVRHGPDDGTGLP
jgi:Cof subfamily protein (haloacid dehalogenase superfamily)